MVEAMKMENLLRAERDGKVAKLHAKAGRQPVRRPGDRRVCVTMAERKIVHVLISGSVQGVWFRAWTVQEASARGLDGWVRNRRDGDVEALFCGPADKVDDMIRACHRGPESARVSNVEVTEEREAPQPGFRKLPTAYLPPPERWRGS